MSVVRPDNTRAELPHALPGPDLDHDDAAAMAAYLLHRIGVDRVTACRALKIRKSAYYERIDRALDILAGLR